MKEINFIAPRTFKSILTPPPPPKKGGKCGGSRLFFGKKIKNIKVKALR